MSIFKKNSSCAIGKIDGPTAIFSWKKRKAKNEQTQEEFLAFAATQVTANLKPFANIEELLVTKYKATPCTLTESEMCTLKVNIILNRFKELVDWPAPLPPNPTKKQLMAYAQSNTVFEQARNYPAEKLGLVIKAYKIPSDTDKDCIVELEMTTEWMILNNASEEISNELCLWPGVSPEDIEQKTARFVAYACALRRIGRLPFGKQV